MQRDMADYSHWILRLSLSFISVTYSQFLSHSLFHSTSWLPAATGLLPQQRAAVIGLSSNTIGREYCPDHLITERGHSSDCWVFPLLQFKVCFNQMYSKVRWPWRPKHSNITENTTFNKTLQHFKLRKGSAQGRSALWLVKSLSAVISCLHCALISPACLREFNWLLKNGRADGNMC